MANKEGLITLLTDLIKEKLETLEKKTSFETSDLTSLDSEMKIIESKINI